MILSYMHLRLVKVALLVVFLLCSIYLISPTNTAKAHHLHYFIYDFYPVATYPWVSWNLCSHPGGSFPYMPPPNYGYYGVDHNVRAGNIVTTSFTATGVSFSSAEEMPADNSGLIADMLPAPAFSLPANTTFTVIVALYRSKADWRAGSPLMRQKIKLNCTTRVMTSNVITYYS